MIEMNLSDEDNTTFQPFDVNVTQQPQLLPQSDRDELWMLKYVMDYVCLVLGGPGNILSMIIWLRRHIISKNSSALYLAVLAINDLLFLNTFGYEMVPSVISPGSWLHYSLYTVYMTTHTIEPLLVLSFSTERLIAISCPLQVHCIRYILFI